MNRWQLPVLLSLISAIGFVAGGCGGGGEEGVKVTGSVTLGGAGQKDVLVSFLPRDPKMAGSSKGARTDASGKFEIELLPGKYGITLSKMVDASGNVPGPEVDAGQLLEGELREAMPANFTNPESSPLSADIPPEGKALEPFAVDG